MKRVVARLDVKNDSLIKGIHLEGLRKLGDPQLYAKKYYEEGIDEIIFMDAVASLYDRNNLYDLIKNTVKDIFVPVTIGGGIRSLGDIEQALRAGADKVAINTAAIKSPEIISQAAAIYGSQCIVASIEAKTTDRGWEAFIDNGRERTGVFVLEWVRQLQQLGAGELMITSIDQEGTGKGFDTELIESVKAVCQMPIIASGGCGNLQHISDLFAAANPSAMAFANVLHYGRLSIKEIKSHMAQLGCDVRL